MKTAVTYADNLREMDERMERSILKTLGNHNRDAYVITMDSLKQAFNIYMSKYGYLPTEWRDYIINPRKEEK